MSMLKVEKSEKYVGDGSGQCGGVGGSRDEGEDLAALMEQDLGDYDDSVESFMETETEGVSETSRGYERFYKEEVSSVTASASTLYDFEEDSSSGVVEELETVPKAGICESQNLQFKGIHDVEVAVNFQSIEGERNDVVESEVSNDGVGAPVRQETKSEGKSNIVVDEGGGSEDKGSDIVEESEFVNTAVKQIEAVSDTELEEEEKDDRGSDGKDDLLETVSPTPGKNETKAFSETNLELPDEREDLESPKSQDKMEIDTQDESAATRLSETDYANIAESGSKQIVSGDPDDAELLTEENKKVISGSSDCPGEKVMNSGAHTLTPGTLLYSGTNSEHKSPLPNNKQHKSGASDSDGHKVPVLAGVHKVPVLADVHKVPVLAESHKVPVLGITKGSSIKINLKKKDDENDPSRSSDMKNELEQKLKDQKDIISNDECNSSKSSDVEDMEQELTDQKDIVSNDDSSSANISSDVENDTEQELTDQQSSLSYDECDVNKSSDMKDSMKQLADHQSSLSYDDCDPNKSSDMKENMKQLTDQQSSSYDECDTNKISEVEADTKQLTDQEDSASYDECDSKKSSDMEEELTNQSDSASNESDGKRRSDVGDDKEEVTTQSDSASNESDGKRRSDVGGDKEEVTTQNNSVVGDKCGGKRSSDVWEEITDMKEGVLKDTCGVNKDMDIEDMREERLVGTQDSISNDVCVSKIKGELVTGKVSKTAENKEEEQQESNISPTSVQKKRKLTHSRKERSNIVKTDLDSKSEDQERSFDSVTTQIDDGDAVNRAVSNVVRVKRKLEEILETSKAEEEAAIQELEKMRREKSQILNKLTSEMVRLKTLLLRDKDRKQEK